tara:strand:- start:199 stop:600 length:402 start_codon:yes stop_codon:yes gene_type:complete
MRFKKVSDLSIELKEPAHVIRFWTERHNVHVKQKTRYHHKYYDNRSVAQLRLIRKLYRESFMAAQGVDKILKKKGYKNVKDVRKSKTILLAESKRSSLQRQESIGTQRVQEKGTDDYEDVSEIPEDYWDQYIT